MAGRYRCDHTLFIEDLETAKGFYDEVFGLLVVYQDENSAVFRFGETLVNLLRATEAPSLVAPATVAPRDAGVRHHFTLGVEDVTSAPWATVLEPERCGCAQKDR
jgi:catechol 2,3-dioxygenase-like lactoylglutathione lyase family enzyme